MGKLNKFDQEIVIDLKDKFKNMMESEAIKES